jgi:hypothetical protein
MIIIIAGLALAIAALVKLAEARGRNRLLWPLLGGVVGIGGLFVGFAVSAWATVSAGDNTAMLAAFAPLVLAFASVLGVAGLLYALPIGVSGGRAWPIASPRGGTGRLELGPTALTLAWDGAPPLPPIPRASVREVRVEGECLVLVWDGGEATLMPMGRPQSRDGRIAQSRALARRITAAA